MSGEGKLFQKDKDAIHYFAFEDIQLLIKTNILTWKDVHNKKSKPDTFELINPERINEILIKLDELKSKAPQNATPLHTAQKEKQPVKQVLPKQIKSSVSADMVPKISKQAISLPAVINLGKEGKVQVITQDVILTKESGHIYEQEGKYQITAAGYTFLNKSAGVSILTPPTVIVNGKEQGNPYIIRNKDSHNIEIVNIRKISFGRAPTGNLTAIDQTLSYAPKSYFIKELTKLLKIPDLAEMRTKQSLSEAEQKNCYFEEITSGFGILIKNINHQEFINKVKNLADNQIMGDRKAQTICERNCLRKHPAIGTSSVKIEGAGSNVYAKVQVYSFIEPNPDKITGVEGLIQEGKTKEAASILGFQYIKSVDDAEIIEEEEIIAGGENGKE